jgi:hypothetical protein
VRRSLTLVTHASGAAELAGAAALLAGRSRLARWWLRLPVQGLFARHVIAGTRD